MTPLFDESGNPRTQVNPDTGQVQYFYTDPNASDNGIFLSPIPPSVYGEVTPDSQLFAAWNRYGVQYAQAFDGNYYRTNLDGTPLDVKTEGQEFWITAPDGNIYEVFPGYGIGLNLIPSSQYGGRTLIGKAAPASWGLPDNSAIVLVSDVAALGPPTPLSNDPTGFLGTFGGFLQTGGVKVLSIAAAVGAIQNYFSSGIGSFSSPLETQSGVDTGMMSQEAGMPGVEIPTSTGTTISASDLTKIPTSPLESQSSVDTGMFQQEAGMPQTSSTFSPEQIIKNVLPSPQSAATSAFKWLLGAGGTAAAKSLMPRTTLPSTTLLPQYQNAGMVSGGSSLIWLALAAGAALMLTA